MTINDYKNIKAFQKQLVIYCSTKIAPINTI